VLVRKLALPADKLQALGDDPSGELELFLGPSPRWIYRKTLLVPLLHEQSVQLTRAFTPVHVGPVRAMFSQLVAIDTEFRPHLTGIVGQVELREGQGRLSPACVLELDLDALKWGVAGLRPMAYDELTPSMFIQPEGHGEVGCACCHSYDGASAPPAQPEVFRPTSLTDAETADELARRRTALLSQLHDLLERLPR
jgi:hypothetical protein